MLQHRRVLLRAQGGFMPLHVAAAEGRLLILRELLLRGAAVDAVDKDGNMPLHLACETVSRPLYCPAGILPARLPRRAALTKAWQCLSRRRAATPGPQPWAFKRTRVLPCPDARAWPVSPCPCCPFLPSTCALYPH